MKYWSIQLSVISVLFECSSASLFAQITFKEAFKELTKEFKDLKGNLKNVELIEYLVEVKFGEKIKEIKNKVEGIFKLIFNRNGTMGEHLVMNTLCNSKDGFKYVLKGKFLVWKWN